MFTSKLTCQIQKQITPDGCAEYFIARLAEFPENEWLYATNSVDVDSRGNSYSIFNELYQKGLVAKTAAPIWRDGSYCGQRIRFLYRHDLNYGEQNAQ